MASSVSEQPGPSSGAHQYPLSRLGSFDEVDIGLVVDDHEAPSLREIFNRNNLRLIAVDGWGVNSDNGSSGSSRGTEDGGGAVLRREGKEEVARLEGERAELAKELREANQKVEEMKEGALAAQLVISQQQEEAERGTVQREEMGRRLEETEAEVGVLQFQFMEQQERFEAIQGQMKRNKAALTRKVEEVTRRKEEEVKHLEGQLRQANSQVAEEKAIAERLLEEKGELERRIQEELVAMEARFLEGTTQMEQEFQRERNLWEGKLWEAGSKRKKDVEDEQAQRKALQETWNRLNVKAREFAVRTGFLVPPSEIVLSEENFANFCNHLINSGLGSSERLELEKNRKILQQFGAIFNKFNGKCMPGNTTFDPPPLDTAEPIAFPAAGEAGQSENQYTNLVETVVTPSTSPCSDVGAPTTSLDRPVSADLPPFETPVILNITSVSPSITPAAPANQVTLTSPAPSPPLIILEDGDTPAGELMEVEEEMEDDITLEAVGLNSPPPGDSVPLSPSGTITLTRDRERRRSNICKQMTPFVMTNKPHGVNRTSTVPFQCLCEEVYRNDNGLRVHIQKMTKEWKYHCENCRQYFFFKCHLQGHMARTRCGIRGIDPRAILEAAMAPSGTTTAPITTAHSPGRRLNGEEFKTGLDYVKRQKMAHCPPQGQGHAAIAVVMPHRSNNVSQSVSPETTTTTGVPSPPSPITVAGEPEDSSEPDNAPISDIDSASPGVIPGNMADPEEVPIPVPPPSQDANDEPPLHAPLPSNPLAEEPENYNCQCGASYMTRGGLMCHLSKMKLGRIYACLHCPQKFYTILEVTHHTQTVHHIPHTSFRCGICLIICKSSKSFNIHRHQDHPN